MRPSLLALFALLVLVIAVAALVAKLFWPVASQAADADDPWAQHNEARTPSLEQPPEAHDRSVDVAVAAQSLGATDA